MNEAPIRWWGGRRGWLEDWDNVLQQSHGMGPVPPGHGNPLAFREPLGRGPGGSGAFLDEEISASFDGAGGASPGSTDLSAPGFVHALQVGVNGSYEMDGVSVPRALPMPVPPGVTRLRMQNDGPRYGEVEVGAPPIEGGFGFVIRKTQDNLTHCDSRHLHGNASGFAPDGIVSGRFPLVALLVNVTLS